MNSDEPTIPGLPMPGDPEGTVMMPNPAGRRSPVTRVLSRSAPAPEPADAAIGFPVAVGLNPLVAAANPLLNLVARLRATLNHDNPARLLDTLTAAVREFESRLTAQGVPAQDIHMAGYLLCAFLDEVIAGTPWGRSGVLAERNLLLAIHGEAYGGDKAFEVLTRLAEEPARNRDLLGLYYVCLSLGFRGRLSETASAFERRDITAAGLARTMGWSTGSAATALSSMSPQWAPLQIKASRVRALVPLWVVPAIAGVVFLGIYLALNADLNRRSGPALHQLVALAVQSRSDSDPGQGKPRLATALAGDIAAGRLEVRDEAMRSVITLGSDRLFSGGGTRIEPEFSPVLARIAKVLAAGAGQVVIVGHTDAAPVSSVQYPTSWHLSLARAQAVANVLAASGLPAERMRPEGRGDAEPRSSGPADRGAALDRRIEIQWLLPRPDR